MKKQPINQRRRNAFKHCKTRVPVNSRLVDISRLKDFVEDNFPPGSPLQIVLADEEDLLSAEAFLAKLPIWLKLTKLSTKD
jgi:hypothetical protein